MVVRLYYLGVNGMKMSIHVQKRSIKKIFDLGLLEFVDVEPTDVNPSILRVDCIYVFILIYESEFMGKEKTV